MTVVREHPVPAAEALAELKEAAAAYRDHGERHGSLHPAVWLRGFPSSLRIRVQKGRANQLPEKGRSQARTWYRLRPRRSLSWLATDNQRSSSTAYSFWRC